MSSDWMKELAAEQQPAALEPELSSMVVFGASGGVGSSVVSALTAGYWADRGGKTAWLDCAPSDSDTMERLGGHRGSPTMQQPETTVLWRPQITTLAGGIDQARQEGLTAIVDAGATATSRAREMRALCDLGTVPVLVIGVRPDLLNRARRVLQVWKEHEILGDAVIVLNTTVPGIRAEAVQEQTLTLLTTACRDCIGVDYDALLGTGGWLDNAGRESLAEETSSAIAALATHMTPRPGLAVAQ